jgi:GntR family transcriptional regulator
MPHALAGGNLTFHPLYEEVKNHITRSLIAGEWKPGAAIPSESRLAEHFNVSVGTVRKAIDELVAEKILVRQQGRGTFVTTHSEDRQLYYFFHIVGKDGGKEPPAHELLSFRKGKADSEESLRLGVSRGDRVVRIHNVLKLAGKPVELDAIVIAAARFPDLTEAIFSARAGTIYGLYQARYGINVVRISERLSAAHPDAQTARVLGVTVNTPMLMIKRVAYTYHDAPVELRTGWVDTGDHEYLSDLWKNETRKRGESTNG